jgi:hypothetical protein
MGMPRSNLPSRAQAIRQALEQADQPLSFDQLLAATRKKLPLDASSLKAGLSAVSNSYGPEARLIQRLAENQYGWLPKLVIGTVLRHTLTKEELKKQRLFFEPEILTALFPAGIRLRQGEALDVEMPEGERRTVSAEIVGEKGWRSVWGTRADSAFWEWLKRQGAQSQDTLLFRIEPGDRPSCRLTLERKTARDETRVQERNTQLAEAAFAFIKTHHRGVMLEDIAARLLAQGVYHDPCPPDSLESAVNQDPRFRWEHGYVKPATRYDRLYQELGIEEPGFFEILAAEDKPTPPAHRQWPSRKERAGQLYRFQAAFRHNKSLWRRIEIRGDQSLRELDREMRVAFGHETSDHLSEFYVGVDAEADRRGLGEHNPFERGAGDEWRIGELGLSPGDELSYTYDFGDNIQHVLTLEAVTTPERGVKYPRISEQNKPRYRYCEICRRTGKKEIATWFCIECSNEKQKEVLVCEKHIASGHEDHYAEEVVY